MVIIALSMNLMVKQKLFDICNGMKENQAKKYTKNRIVSKIKSEISDRGNTIEDFKESIEEICDVSKIDTLYAERIEALSQMLAASNYQEIVSIFDFDHKINHYVQSITIDYLNRIIRLIKKSPELQGIIKTEYYSEIPVF